MDLVVDGLDLIGHRIELLGDVVVLFDPLLDRNLDLTPMLPEGFRSFPAPSVTDCVLDVLVERLE
ncbi:hypothetical protein AQJ67_33050 [Streptomyces caeruleatus]|uniref:Uncharacterized protein n=1 Tax=Streptomyces caeruleatus TaxID=661399 RepID=A0A124I7F6_9ACTN|nr:hypothetical protein AQJ67_33050 [Streptomyces caeruleatus]